MRVVVGATGNVGTSLLTALAAEERVEPILGLATACRGSTCRRSSGAGGDH